MIALVLIGGKGTSTLNDGKPITYVEELNKIKAMKLLDCEKLQDSYVRLRYEVIKSSIKNQQLHTNLLH